MLIYHTVGHNMSVADGGDCVEATMTAEEIQIEETDIEVVKNNDFSGKYLDQTIQGIVPFTYTLFHKHK